MTFGQKHNLDKVKRKMIFEKTVFYDILYLSIIQIKKGGIESVNKSKRGIREYHKTLFFQISSYA